MHRSLTALLAACLLPAARILCHAYRCLRSLLYATRAAFHAGRDSVDARCGWFRQYRFLRQGAVLGCMRHQALARGAFNAFQWTRRARPPSRRHMTLPDNRFPLFGIMPEAGTNRIGAIIARRSAAATKQSSMNLSILDCLAALPIGPQRPPRSPKPALGVASVAREHADIDSDLAQRSLVLPLDVRAEDKVRVGRTMQPAVLLDLVLKLTRRPTGVAERQHRVRWSVAARDRLQDLERGGKADPLVDRQCRIFDEEIRRVQDEAAPGLDRTSSQHPHLFDARRQLYALTGRNDFELYEQVREPDVRRGLVDHDAHGPLAGMRTDIDQAAREPLVSHRRHGNQHLTVEVAVIGRPIGPVSGKLHGGRLSNRHALANEIPREGSNNRYSSGNANCGKIVVVIVATRSRRLQWCGNREPVTRSQHVDQKGPTNGHLRNRCGGHVCVPGVSDRARG